MAGKSKRSAKLRVAIVCSGMDNVKRGFESHARDLFELLRGDGQFELTLIKGSGARRADERVVFNLSRDSLANRMICRVIGTRWRYYIECASFGVGVMPLVLLKRFDAMYVLEGPVYKFLRRAGRFFGWRGGLIHCTGGWFDAEAPARVLRTGGGSIIPPGEQDYLHHVTPCYISVAERCGFRPENQFLVPHFIHGATAAVTHDETENQRLRASLGIPEGMPVVLSVGSIDTQHKRMDYVIRECARAARRVFVLLIGHQDAASAQIGLLASRELGANRFAIRTVPRNAIFNYYALADVFVLASLQESFGIVFLEALACGVPVIAHDYEVSRYVLGEQGYFADLSSSGALAAALEEVLAEPQTEGARQARARRVRQKYEAQAVKDDYRRMFLHACGVH